MTIKNLEVLEMPNGEILCLGKTIGWVKDLGKFLSDAPDTHTKPIIQAIMPKVSELLDTVREYESDTFSAEESELTTEEAVSITTELIEFELNQLIELDRLDGVRLSEELENIRD